VIPKIPAKQDTTATSVKLTGRMVQQHPTDTITIYLQRTEPLAENLPKNQNKKEIITP